MNLLRKEVVIPVIAIVVAIAVIVGLLALKNTILIASELSAYGTDNANAEDDEMNTPTSYDIATSTNHVSNDAATPSADMQSLGNHENDTIEYDYSMLEYDEVYVPGYSVPLKIGMSQEEFENSFEDYIEIKSSNSGDLLGYSLVDSQVKIVLFESKVHAIVVLSDNCFTKTGILVGYSREDIYNIMGEPPVEPSINLPDPDSSFYYYDNNGNLCDFGNAIISVGFSFESDVLIKIYLSPA